jgi:DNA-binding FrmR family transcriptional regulator
MFMHAQAEAMTLDKLAMMVQAGFLDMGDRFERVEGRLTNVERTVSDMQIELHDVKTELHDVKKALPDFTTVNMHLQLTRRVCVIEEHLKI